MSGVAAQRFGVVATRPQLGQDEQFHAPGRGTFDHAESDGEILLGIAGRGQPLRHPDQKVSLHVPTRFMLLARSCQWNATGGTFGDGFPVVNALLQSAPDRTPTASIRPADADCLNPAGGP